MAKQKIQKKNPWIAAVLNFLVAGAGYLYIGKRKTFGTILLVSWIIAVGSEIVNPSPELTAGAFVAAVVAMLGFAYDAYTLSQD